MSYQQRFRLDGERAVVTGGGRGIGLCCAEALAEAGARLVIIERSEEDAAEAVALREKGFEVDLALGNVTDPARLEAIAAGLAEAGLPATILVDTRAPATAASRRRTWPTRTGSASRTSTSTASSGARAPSDGT